MGKMSHYCKIRKWSKTSAMALSVALALLFVVGCSRPQQHSQADSWNALSYQFHYRNIDSTRFYAEKAYAASESYDEGRAEALNNLAFVSMIKMDYKKARKQLEEVYAMTDNQIELLVADVQMMRICQRESKNKDFYTYRQRAIWRLNRIREERDQLTPSQKRRLVYAQSEYSIVASTYFYYVGLDQQSIAAFNAIDPTGGIVKDTAQLLNYYYNLGSGGLIVGDNKDEVCLREFESLVRCYVLARQGNYPYWMANALQAFSEHLQNPAKRMVLYDSFKAEIQMINTDQMPDSLLAGNLAQRAMQLFDRFGDAYQMAGAYRTLAECYRTIGDYRSAIICLETALSKNKAVAQAPDLVASIREQLSLTYSAIDNKVASDANRNAYLDMQEITRQDRELEARAEQLDWQANLLNGMILAVVFMILFVASLLLCFAYMRKRSDRHFSLDSLLHPLEKWKEDNVQEEERLQEVFDEIEEKTAIAQSQLLNNKRRNVEQRAKVSLAYSIIPLISRITHEVGKKENGKVPLYGNKGTLYDSKGTLYDNKGTDYGSERMEYAIELTDKISEYNARLTQWIQMRQGDISLHVESFSLQELFDVVSRAKTEYQVKGINFSVSPTTDVVKADKILTLFMINTMAENARKFTPKGGRITIGSTSADEYVEISVSDTGAGIAEEQIPSIFSHKFKAIQSDASTDTTNADRPHGFGLVNCKGIIEKYRKMSTLFRVCDIGVESELGKGSRFFFRLPKGVARVIFLALLLMPSVAHLKAQSHPEAVSKADAFADSAYFSNINGTYQKTIAYADSCIKYLNIDHAATYKNDSARLQLKGNDARSAAELQWFGKRLQTDYATILDFRNETAVAALALHDWALYEYNNKVYTQLFREYSSDSTLAEYVKVMQKSESNKNVAIFILVFLLICIFPAYYFLYYRHRVRYQQSIERINAINQVLLSNTSDEKKLSSIEAIWKRQEAIADEESADIQGLNSLVGKIKEALQMRMEHTHRRNDSLTVAKEGLNRVEREKEKYYVSNNILDNCLSTLKHETMYYPSRIRQLLTDGQGDMTSVSELVGYYNELYTILCEQAMRQIDLSGRIDPDMVDYLFDLLCKLNGGQRPRFTADEGQQQYVRIQLCMDALSLNAQQQAELFTPATCDFRFLICKQIIREWGEQTNARGCGIRCLNNDDSQTIIEITLTQQIWKNSKLSS